MKIYTCTGDHGETSLRGGERVRKDALRIEAIGCVDETNAAIGVARVELQRSGVDLRDVDAILVRVQHLLFHIGAELASRTGAAPQESPIGDEDVSRVESEIDRCEARLTPLQTFILPAGVPEAAQLHMARCVCRRAERRLVELSAAETVRGELLRYMNRLGDLLFVLARVANHANRVADAAWRQSTCRSPCI